MATINKPSRRHAGKAPGPARWALCLLSGCLCLGAQAAALQKQLDSGLTANAEYHAAQGPDAVLLLHGFLATHHFPTIQRLADELKDNGFAVLAPTLTLGINDRRTSLPCSALHLHTMEETLHEIRWWVDWLADQGYENLYIVGHSAGSLQALAYSLDDPNPAVRRLVLTSLVALEPLPGAKPTGASPAQARAWLAEGNDRIAEYDVSFCQGSFAAPPGVYLSYHAWDRDRVVRALADTPIPAAVIIGSNDQRFTGPAWLNTLQQAAPALRVLPNSNHFFDGMGEFALLDALLEELHSAPLRPEPAP